jgi:hypothetical protein
MDKPTSQKWRSFTPARSGKMVHYCSGDWRSFAPALTSKKNNNATEHFASSLLEIVVEKCS